MAQPRARSLPPGAGSRGAASPSTRAGGWAQAAGGNAGCPSSRSKEQGRGAPSVGKGERQPDSPTERRDRKLEERKAAAERAGGGAGWRALAGGGAAPDPGAGWCRQGSPGRRQVGGPWSSGPWVEPSGCGAGPTPRQLLRTLRPQGCEHLDEGAPVPSPGVGASAPTDEGAWRGLGSGPE